jgi:choloylglycine hydrolase
VKAPFSTAALVSAGASCSTFALRQGDTFIIGHNLDEPFHVPGVIVVNKRGVRKTSVSLMELLTGQPSSSPTTSWTSKYGSVTLCPFGREFPDGGINEAGLYIQEMTLPDTRFPEDDDLPKMFMMQWMQYQLDNHESVEQVLATLSQIVLDGWTWHFFTCDKSGVSAAIEFVDGQTHVYTGDDMPIPVLCNTAYPQELDNLKDYRGFGGAKPFDPDDKDTERFVHAAYMVAQPVQAQPIGYGFDILRTLERGSTQWSYVIDVRSGQVSFFTARAKTRKTFCIDAFDYACDTLVKVLDIHTDLEGGVTALFADYAPELNRQLVSEQIKSLDRNGDVTRLVESFGRSLSDVIDAISGYSDTTRCIA